MSDWASYVSRRDELVRAFATVVSASVTRCDTSHPAFHGCFDWHSAVHGTYALLAASRLTGDPAFAEVARSQTAPAAVAAEVAALTDGRLDHEIPYGLAWALILDAEAARADIGAFRELAIAARNRVVAHLDGLVADGTLTAAAADEEYPSAIWSTIALRRWGVARDDALARDTAERIAAPILGNFSRHCLGRTAAPMAGRGFFSPVHLAVLLAADLDATTEAAALIADPQFGGDLLVGDDEPTVHSAGLNFSRAWGLYGACRITRQSRWRDAAAGLIAGHAARPDRWRDDYARYAHWIPQFGVFAVAETVDHL